MAQYNNQTSNPYQELKGSAKCYIAAYTSGTPTWYNVGPIRGLEVNEDLTSVDIEFDNTASRKYVSKQEFTATFQQMQRLNSTLLQILRNGVDEFTTTAGTPVAGGTQLIASPFTPNDFYAIEYQNGDGTIITINSVTGSVDGALTADDDYHLVVDDNGIYGIILNTVAGGTNITTVTQTVTIDYDYTPSASFKVEVGGASELPYIMMKFETITQEADGTAGLFTSICYRGQQEEGTTWVYTQDEADDPLIANPITYRFFEDPNRTSNGKNLVMEYNWTTS